MSYEILKQFICNTFHMEYGFAPAPENIEVANKENVLFAFEHSKKNEKVTMKVRVIADRWTDPNGDSRMNYITYLVTCSEPNFCLACGEPCWCPFDWEAERVD